MNLSFRKYLIISFSFLLIILLFNQPFTSTAQAPKPTPGAEDTGEPISLYTAEPSAFEPTLDWIQEADDFSCTTSADNWVTKAMLPSAVYGSGVASDGRYVYSAGGFGTSISNQFARYDPSADQWVLLAPLPIPVRNMLAVFAEGKLYFFGGDDTSAIVNYVQIYDIASGVWSSGSPMPGVRQQMGGGFFNGKIFVAGGYQTAGVDSASNQTWEYTISTNSWRSVANLPASLAGPGSGIINGNLFIVGGRDSAGIPLNSAYSYNILADTWSTVASLPTATNTPGSAVYNDRIWVFGGGDPFLAADTISPDSPDTLIVTQIYDPSTNTWQYGPSQRISRSFQGGAVVHNQIVSVGGYASGASPITEVLTQNPLKILIIYADVHRFPEQLRLSLMGLPGVGQVDAYDGQSGTPSLSQLKFYDIVVPYSNSIFASATDLGNNLAVYQDNGGIVVGFVFDWTEGYSIAGLWMSGGYSPFTIGPNLFANGSLGSYTQGHPLMKKVYSLNAYFRMNPSLSAGAVQVAAWNDGKPLIAYKGRAVGVSAYIGEYSDNWSGDFAQIIVNAGNWLWLGNRTCDALVCTAPKVFHGTLSETDWFQIGRLLRNDPPSSCDVPGVCPGPMDSISYPSDSYQLMNNTSTDQCITVTLDSGTCDATSSLQSAAYLGTFDSANICANYLADIGGSPTYVKSYSFIVPPWQVYTVVVNGVTNLPACPNYTLTVSAGDCMMNNIYIPIVLRTVP